MKGSGEGWNDVSHLGRSCCIVLSDRCFSRACAMLSQHWLVLVPVLSVSTFCQTPTIFLLTSATPATTFVRYFSGLLHPPLSSFSYSDTWSVLSTLPSSDLSFRIPSHIAAFPLRFSPLQPVEKLSNTA